MPRAVTFLYTLRSKRGFGHPSTDGSLDANAIDAATCVRVADWCLSELIREVGAIPIHEAQAALDTISARQLPSVWIVGDRKRVLHPGLDYREQTLLLLYMETNSSAAVDVLFKWTEHNHKTRYTRDVLGALHRERLVEHDKRKGAVTLSPKGAGWVEEHLLPRLARALDEQSAE